MNACGGEDMASAFLTPTVDGLGWSAHFKVLYPG